MLIINEINRLGSSPKRVTLNTAQTLKEHKAGKKQEFIKAITQLSYGFYVIILILPLSQCRFKAVASVSLGLLYLII